MSNPKQPLDLSNREQILDALVRRESDDPESLPAGVDERTIHTLLAEIDTLVATLRQSPPLDPFAEESDCQRATEMVERLGTRKVHAAEQLGFEKIGPYQVVARLSRGGMGWVYKAIHPKLRRVVAIKVLPASRMRDAAAISRFQREIEAVGRLAHPNIVAATDAGEVDGMHYLVMEYVDGLDLSTLSHRIGPLAPADACEIARQAALGLKEAHNHGIIHRDIKPSNLILADSGHESTQPVVKVLDFGLARLAPLGGDVDELTLDGQIMGTLRYMAPEQCAGSRDVDLRADIYSLGATLYRFLCGEPPYSAAALDSPLALLAALANEEPLPLSTQRSDLPPLLVALVERMMAKKPADRFAALDEVIEALTPWSAGADLAELLVRAGDAEGADSVWSSTADPPPDLSRAVVVDWNRPLRPRTPSRAWLLMGGVLAGLLSLFVLGWSFNLIPAAMTSGASSSDPFEQARRVADWLVSQRATFGVGVEGRGFMTIKPGDALPTAPFHLVTANIDGNTSINDSDLARFDALPFFGTFTLSRTAVGDRGLQHLGSLPMLKDLFLSQNRITDVGLAELRRFPRLATLHLNATGISDDGLAQLTTNHQLSQLALSDCNVSDDGLTHLRGLKHLRLLHLRRTGVTRRGIAELRVALPECTIASDFSDQEIDAEIERVRNDRPSSARDAARRQGQ